MAIIYRITYQEITEQLLIAVRFIETGRTAKGLETLKELTKKMPELEYPKEIA